MTATTTRRPLIESLADAAYHARQLLLALERIDPDDADQICDREHYATAFDLADTLAAIDEHPAAAFLPVIP